MSHESLPMWSATSSPHTDVERLSCVNNLSGNYT